MSRPPGRAENRGLTPWPLVAAIWYEETGELLSDEEVREVAAGALKKLRGALEASGVTQDLIRGWIRDHDRVPERPREYYGALLARFHRKGAL